MTDYEAIDIDGNRSQREVGIEVDDSAIPEWQTNVQFGWTLGRLERQLDFALHRRGRRALQQRAGRRGAGLPGRRASSTRWARPPTTTCRSAGRCVLRWKA